MPEHIMLLNSSLMLDHYTKDEKERERPLKEVNKLATFKHTFPPDFISNWLLGNLKCINSLQEENHLCVPSKAHLLVKQKNKLDCRINFY